MDESEPSENTADNLTADALSRLIANDVRFSPDPALGHARVDESLPERVLITLANGQRFRVQVSEE